MAFEQAGHLGPQRLDRHALSARCRQRLGDVRGGQADEHRLVAERTGIHLARVHRRGGDQPERAAAVGVARVIGRVDPESAATVEGYARDVDTVIRAQRDGGEADEPVFASARCGHRISSFAGPGGEAVRGVPVDRGSVRRPTMNDKRRVRVRSGCPRGHGRPAACGSRCLAARVNRRHCRTGGSGRNTPAVVATRRRRLPGGRSLPAARATTTPPPGGMPRCRAVPGGRRSGPAPGRPAGRRFTA